MSAVDVEGALRVWLNSLTGLVGRGKPLTLGAHARRLRSPFAGCYALTVSQDGSDDLTAEAMTSWEQVTADIYSPTTRENAKAAAVAYATTLRSLNAIRPVVDVGGGSLVQLLFVGKISGPHYDPIDDEERFTVTAEIHAVKA